MYLVIFIPRQSNLLSELEKRIPLAAQTIHCAELEELQELLHFPEEVALRLADTEYQLFYQVPPIDYLRQVTLDLGGATTTAAESLPGNSSTRSSVSTLIKRFNEVSAWITQLIISQPTHDARRAVLSCVLRVALSSWNIGNFNGAMEIIAGLKSNKLKPFWLSITEKETLPILDFLSAALLSAEYDRALSRALSMAECPVVPFFGAFLRELREILAAQPTMHDHNVKEVPPPSKSPKFETRRDRDQDQQRQVFISDYNGEDHHFTKVGPGGLINLEKIYKTQAVMDHISLCHQHYHSRNRFSSTTTILEYLKSTASDTQHIIAATPPEKIELDEEYEFEVDGYHPVQPLVHDHGVSFVCLSSPLTKIDQHVMQILHHGSTVVLWEGVEGPTAPGGPRGILQYLRLDRSSTTLTWVRPSWSGLKTGYSNETDPFSTDFNLSFNPEETLAPGLLTKLALQGAGEQSTGSTLDDGIWFSGLSWLIHGLIRQESLSDRRLFWLREQYMQLYHEDGYCCGPLAADAIRSFGGRDWSLAGVTPSGQAGESPGVLRREVSMKIKKKQLLSNQTFKDRSLRSHFVEPATMCMESSYWRNPTHHRQSTPTTFLEHHPDVARHHSLGQLAYHSQSQPKFDRDRHGSTEHLWHGRHPRVGSILYDTQLDFVDFVLLFRSFSLLIRKDLRDLFDQLAISYRSLAVNTTTKLNGVKAQVDKNRKPQKLGLLTRNSHTELEGIVNSQKRSTMQLQLLVVTMSTFMKFLETRQMEILCEDEVKLLIERHEPDPSLRAQLCLSFEGFARYLMDKSNYAFINEQETPDESEMGRPMSTYYIASSHNTYLTGHQLKGESSVELYSQVLLTGCRCVELDCWDGDDGFPMIYHGHTFTTKIPFSAVVETIQRHAFTTSPYPVILSIENHCSLQQQNRMAHIFQRIFGDKLVTNFLFDVDYSDEPMLPSPEQLKYRILIKNKKLITEVPLPLPSYPSMSTPITRPTSGIRHSVPGRTSSIIKKTMHGILSASDSPRSYGIAHVTGKSSSAKKGLPEDKLKKRSSQISKDLSDMVVYVQAIKFRGLNTISPSSSVKQRPKTCLSSSGSSIVTTISSSTSNVSSTAGGPSMDSETTLYEAEPKPVRPITHPCYQCSSINENTAKKLCRKQPLALVAHTQTQLMRTYPAGMRIDSSNFNPVIFWSFGIQMAALNYQTDDIAMQLNTAMFEMNGRCGFVSKPNVMWDRSHVMYRRFNPWDKEFDGLHSSQIVINVVSGQYVTQANVNASTYVEVEIIGIPVDCNKQKTRTIQKNALNPIWNDTFHFRVMFRDLAFLKFCVMDGTSNHLLAQRILPLKCLRPGYRHLRLRSPQNRELNMSTLFIYSRTEEESIDNSDAGDALDRKKKDGKTQIDSGSDNTYLGISGTPLCVKRRMFFLMVYGVVAEEPYTILKVTQESTTQEVLTLALQKANISVDKINDYIIVEEVARGWEKKDHDLPSTQRILDLDERPLQAQSQWKGEGKLILKRMGDDPSSRAWLSSIRSVANREREARKSDGAPSNAWEENDTFLVCIYNVSPEIPYCILKVPLNACSQDVIAQALVKARRLEDPTNFVIVEELEWGGISHNLQQRALADDENVYSAQSHWQTIGRFIMQERAHATPTSLRKSRVATSLRLATLDRISRGLNAARSAATNSIKAPVQAALSDPTTSKWKSKTGEDTKNKGFVRGKVNSEKEVIQPRSQCQREVHSEGETLSDDESKDSDLMAAVSRLKKVSLRKFKEWKS
ncbi:hypothetical protein FQR65_LT08550 [Abscondita terminalis]|nr:hypothetical protein FQR65_LT08550 [Abscondita terminalis]